MGCALCLNRKGSTTELSAEFDVCLNEGGSRYIIYFLNSYATIFKLEKLSKIAALRNAEERIVDIYIFNE